MIISDYIGYNPSLSAPAKPIDFPSMGFFIAKPHYIKTNQLPNDTTLHNFITKFLAVQGFFINFAQFIAIAEINHN